MSLNLLAAQGLQFLPKGMEPRGERGRMSPMDHLQPGPRGSGAACPPSPALAMRGVELEVGG